MRRILFRVALASICTVRAAVTEAASHTASDSAVTSTPPASLSVPADFTAKPFFQTDFLKSFFSGFGPSQTSVEPQPLVTDPVGKTVFPLDLTNPKTIPTANVVDDVVLPPSSLDPSFPPVSPPTKNFSTPASLVLRTKAFQKISDILNSTNRSDCAKCTDSLIVAKNLTLEVPWEVSPLLVQLCNFVKARAIGSCEQQYSVNSDGQIATQVLANADVAGLDGQWMCAKHVIPIGKVCPTPPPSNITALLSTWFSKPKPPNAVAPTPSGNSTKLRVLHLSDFHLDPRYVVGVEAQCTDFMCCRPGVSNKTLPPGEISLHAPRFGAFKCDAPWNLVDAVLHSIGPLTGTGTGIATKPHSNTTNKFPIIPAAFTMFTGDLMAHDQDNQASRAYSKYIESAVYSNFKAHLGGAPVYAVMGNHDTSPHSVDPPHSIRPGELSSQLEWSYAHLADLWQTEGWISEQVAKVTKTTYSAYSTVTPQGLKIITMNTDFWYHDNWFNYINSSNPDVSGMLRFVTDELQDAEDRKQRVWLLGHVLPGWDGTNALPNGPNLLYQIINRFSPHVIANVFMGHVHDEVRYLNYANNATKMDAQSALMTTWVGGSVTPFVGLNSGFSMYEVDSETFDVMEAYTWFANVSTFSGLDKQTEVGPSYHFEYSTREEYGANFQWPANAPLNATWWHMVTESFLAHPDLVEKFTHNQGRQSSRTHNCTSTECQQAKVCYMRSGSPPIAGRCTPGFGSVQN